MKGVLLVTVISINLSSCVLKFCFTFSADRNYKEFVQLKLGNGQFISLPIMNKEKVFKSPKPDRILDYAKLVLDLGLIYLNFLQACKCPCEERMMPILKMMVVIFKANNNLSKYALEVLRFLILQFSILSEQSASDCFRGMFVNTRGNSHIPADMKMENIVKEQKKHIKHMYANKLDDEVIKKKSGAVHGINRIAEQYDKATNVIVRATAHKEVSSLEDEKTMIHDLRKIRPFRYCPDRCFSQMAQVPSSLSKLLDAAKFNFWFLEKKANYAAHHMHM